MKPVLKKIPGFKLYGESTMMLLRYDYQPINLELISLQIVLSKILQDVMSLKAGNIQLKDVANYNIQKRPQDIQNFFILQEVYGYQYAVNFFEPSITPLSMQRRKVQKDLTILKGRFADHLNKLNDECKDPQQSFGYIYRDLLTLQSLICKVNEYFSAKIDKLGTLSIDQDKSDKEVSNRIEPLFQTLNEPTEQQVGYLIDLKCGHTQRPSDLESVMFTVHLEAAGFMKGKGAVGSPNRSLF